ncbi:MAG: hypothetical protein IRY94_14195 [Rhodospirillaceae bacterium]|nr:hypothetical protein [Rhodospirillaceae bacterium]
MESGGAPARPLLMRGVAAAEIAAVWPRVEPLLARATGRTRGCVSTAAVRERLAARDMQLWITEPLRAACVTEIVAYPHQRWCRVVFAAGEDLALCRAGLAVIEAWARAEGCAGVEIEGRPGWRRVLPGYRAGDIILRKEL